MSRLLRDPPRYDRLRSAPQLPAGERRIVELQDQPGLDDRLVFLAHDFGAGVEEFLVALVIGVADAIGAARRHRGQEPLLDPGSGERRLQIGDAGGAHDFGDGIDDQADQNPLIRQPVQVVLQGLFESYRPSSLHPGASRGPSLRGTDL